MSCGAGGSHGVRERGGRPARLDLGGVPRRRPGPPAPFVGTSRALLPPGAPRLDPSAPPGNPFATTTIAPTCAVARATSRPRCTTPRIASSTCRPGVREQTASIGRVDILVTLLHEERAAFHPLDEDDEALATGMIEARANDEATDLRGAAGGSGAIACFDALAGFTDTTPDTEVAGARRRWRSAKSGCSSVSWWRMRSSIPPRGPTSSGGGRT